MSPVEKQRVIGVILLLAMIAGIAFFLITNASSLDLNDEQSANDIEIEVTPEYSSVVEAISEGDIEIVQEDIEALIEPDKTVVDSKASKIEKKPVIEDASSDSSISKEQKQANSLAILEKKLAKVDVKLDVKVSSEPLWILQLASFSVYENALKLQKKLKESNYLSYIDPVQTSLGTRIYRVRIGPNKDKTALEKVAIIIKSEFQLQAQIIQKSN